MLSQLDSIPRLPLTGNLELFRALARLGGELTALHLLESPKLAQPITEFIGGRHPEVEKISWSRNTVWVDKAQTTGFQDVREDVWNFHIGGYQVCEKWLKDRKGRTLTKDDVAHYQKIVVALSETIRLVKEIDAVIDKHGGWPGAFQTVGSADTVSPDIQPQAAPLPGRPSQVHSNAFVPGELFATEGELTLAKKAPAAREAAKQVEKSRPMRQSPPAAEEPARADVNRDPHKAELMAVIREVLAAKGSCDRETLIQRCAYALGYQRAGRVISEELDNAIRTAKRRGFVYDERGHLHLDRSTVDHWERAFLKDQFLAALSQNGRIWHSRADAARLFARWLGYRRTGHLIEETARSLINGLLRDGCLEKDGADWIRRI